MTLFRRHTEVLAETAPIEGRRLLEVGCGDGRLLGWLARRAALAVGLDPDPAQLARARSAAGGGRLVRGVAERLPFPRGAFDLVLIVNSLHHVPADVLAEALAEAARVLRAGGDLVVVEPLAEGPWFELLRPLEDETEAREQAARAVLAATRRPGDRLGPVARRTYASRVEVPSVEAALDRLLAANPERGAALGRVRPELERRFARLAESAAGGGHAFTQPMRLDHLRRLP